MKRYGIFILAVVLILQINLQGPTALAYGVNNLITVASALNFNYLAYYETEEEIEDLFKRMDEKLEESPSARVIGVGENDTVSIITSDIYEYHFIETQSKLVFENSGIENIEYCAAITTRQKEMYYIYVKSNGHYYVGVLFNPNLYNDKQGYRNNTKEDYGFKNKGIYTYEEFIELCKPRDTRLFIRGEEVFFKNPPVAYAKFTYLPIRDFFEHEGYTVAWDGETKTVICTNDEKSITYEFKVGDDAKYWNKVRKNGEYIEESMRIFTIIDGKAVMSLEYSYDIDEYIFRFDSVNFIVNVSDWPIK